MYKSTLAALPLVLLAHEASALSALPFYPPSWDGPLYQTSNYTGFSNNTLNDTHRVEGKVFNRFIQIWLENTDYNVAASTPTFRNLAQDGITFTNYMALTHPSEPNYVSATGGELWGMHDDDYYHIPSNISCIVDLLEDGGVSWATYQESMPTDGYYGYSYSSPYYGNTSAGDYIYYMRKHNPLEIYDSVSQNATRAARVRNFNDFANDAVNGTLPQWLFITPNMLDDGHDTNIDFAAEWLEYFLVPLLKDKRFNDENTLVLLTFDETELYFIQNRIMTIALGGIIPEDLRGTSDNTYYTHYSTLSTVQNNWGLKSLGRGDTNKTMSNVFEFVANKTGYQNVGVEHGPLLNLTGVYSGPLNSDMYQPFWAPNVSAVGAGGQGVFVSPLLNVSFTINQVPEPVNLTAEGLVTPWMVLT